MKRSRSKHFIIINGPNLNLLGSREVNLYGNKTLKQIEQWTTKKADDMAVKIDWFQSNSETEIIELLHSIKAKKSYEGIVINPAGLSHTSVILLDALLAIESIPIVEVHLTNPCQREEFRRHLLTAKAATMIMGGLGFQVYYFAIKALFER